MTRWVSSQIERQKSMSHDASLEAPREPVGHSIFVWRLAGEGHHQLYASQIPAQPPLGDDLYVYGCVSHSIPPLRSRRLRCQLQFLRIASPLLHLLTGSGDHM